MPGKMKRVVCDGCGLVNLEGFTTFPRCAACGAHLPEETAPSLWKRPVRSVYWTALLGLGIVSALGGVSLLWNDTRPLESEMLLIYAQMPQQAAPDGFIYARFALDSTEVPSPETFNDVRLRLPRSLFDNFRLIRISPTPARRRATGGGLYFEWKRLEREKAITLVLSPRRLGKHEWRVSLYARGYHPFQRRGQVEISAQNALRRGFDAQPQKSRPVPLPFQTPVANLPRSGQPSSLPTLVSDEN